MTALSTVSLSVNMLCNALASCLDKLFEGENEPDIVRRMAGHEFSRHTYCDTTTRSFVVNATRAYLNVYSLRLYTWLVRRSLRVS
jgi:hypothetical protein